MASQKTDTFVGAILSFFTIVCFLLVAVAPNNAHASSGTLDRAFGELQAERYTEALALLDRAHEAAATEGERAKITYYRGFALEKLGQCDAAELAYRRVLDTSRGQKLGGFAREALDGFDSRCIATGTSTTQSKAVEMPRGSGRVGWKVFGWTTMIIGGLALGSLPIKHSLERNVTSQAEPYFQLQYNCDVENGAVSGERCDREGLEKDKAFQEYEASRATAETWSDVIMYGGIGLASVGAATLLLVAVTRPDADDVIVGITPTPNGVVAGASFRF